VSRRLFADRADAGRQLAALVRECGLGQGVVVGLARGGVEVAAEVAEALGLPLDAVAVRKVGHPWQPEYALGAVTPDGTAYVRAHDGLTSEQVEQAVGEARSAAELLDRRIHADAPAIALAGETVILVDDGLATGASMTAAARWAAEADAARVVVAVPVGAPESLAAIAHVADGVFCLFRPRYLAAVGLWYDDFGQVSDARVVELLAAARRRGAAPARAQAVS
jgi:putative phosphoribosyl transferase